MSEHSLHLTGVVHVYPSLDEVYDALAQALCAEAFAAVEARKVFHLALSGGSTPEPFYVRLVTDPRYRSLPWKHTHVWLVDERQVPLDDEKSNFKMIRESLLDQVPMRKRCIHPVNADLPGAAEAYEAELRREVRDGRLDFVLLGMGDDGHTASLFPGSAAVHEGDHWYTANVGQGVTPPPRVTMTYPILNDARHIAILVAGAKKADILWEVDEQVHSHGGPDPEKYPITGIAPNHGRLAWYLDTAAAGGEDEAL